jgi:hypothetical protein
MVNVIFVSFMMHIVQLVPFLEVLAKNTFVVLLKSVV